MKKDVCCLNCGIFGHTTRFCNYPVTSYGLICYKKFQDEIKFIMIQKKDTISYIEFIRGKYDVNNISYIVMLFSKMTYQEKHVLHNFDFKEIWSNLWTITSNEAKFQKDYNVSSQKFNKLKTGFMLSRIDGTLQYIDIKYLLNISSNIDTQEWEFPKGRRKLHESGKDCSIREFCEEVGIYDSKLINLHSKQYEEIFQGSNNVRYRSIYYIAQFMGDESLIKFDSNNLQQIKEVRDVNWFSYEDVIKIMNNKTSEKIELFKRVNNIIKKNYLI